MTDEIVPLALGVALSPIPIAGMILILGTLRARANARAYVAGWIGGLVALSVLGLVLLNGSSSIGRTSDAASALSLALAGACLLVAGLQWRRRPRGSEPPREPRWLAAVDAFTPGRSFGLGAILSGANPKVVLLTLSAAIAVAGAARGTAADLMTFSVFVVLGSLGVLAPAVAYVAMGDRAQVLLEGWKRWLVANSAVVASVVLLLIGLKLAFDGVSGLRG